MDRAEKAEMVESLKGIFSGSGTVVVTHYSGLNVAEMTRLRGKLRERGAQLKVVKNRLAKLALQDQPGASASDMFSGPVAIAYAEDFVSAPKAAVDYAKDNDKLIVIGGMMGEEVLDKDGIEQLAKLPSLDELRGKLIGLLQAPATKLAGVTQAPAGQLARVFGAYGASDAA